MKAKTFTKVLVVLIIAVYSVGFYFYVQPKTITIHSTEIVVRDVGVSLEDKIEDLKETLLDDLRYEEIKGYENRSLVIVFDPLQKDLAKCREVGGVRLHCYSTGDFNFKVATVQHYYSKFYNETLNDKEAFMIAMDSELSRELAKKVIFEEKGGIYNWINSSKKINGVSRVTFIKNLEK